MVQSISLMMFEVHFLLFFLIILYLFGLISLDRDVDSPKSN